MRRKLWNVHSIETDIENDPEYILNDYANQVEQDTNNEFLGLVTDTVKEDTGEVSYVLYIVVPKLNDYMYRLIEVTLQNIVLPYPLEMKLFAQDPKNHKSIRCYNATEYR